MFPILNEEVSEDVARRFGTLSSSYTRLNSVNTLFYARINGRLLHWTDEVGRDAASFRTSTEAAQIHHLMITLTATHVRPDGKVQRGSSPEIRAQPAITNWRRRERWDTRRIGTIER